MDFPGTINQDFEHFMHHVLDITRSLAYHGFKKIILLNDTIPTVVDITSI